MLDTHARPKDFMVWGGSMASAGFEIRRVEVQILFWLLADVVLGSSEFNLSATLLNSQLVYLPPVLILNLVMFIWILVFAIVCLHWSWGVASYVYIYGRVNGLCVLKASTDECKSMLSINHWSRLHVNLDWSTSPLILGQHLINILVDSQSRIKYFLQTLYQLSIKTYKSFYTLPTTDLVLIKSQWRCWWRVNQGSVKGINPHLTADASITPDPI